MDSRVRASPEQLSTLLEYMETHGDLARPLIGAQGRVRSDRLWADLTNILNSVGGGVTKTTEKWKKVWADWKSKTKKKGLVISQHSRGTGGGPASRQTLSAMDERVLAIMGALAVEGQASVEEIGFTRSQSPAQEDSLILQIVDETSHLPLPEEPQPSTSQLLPPPSSTTFIPTHTPRPSPVAPASPAAPAAPAPPAPAAPTTPRRRRPPATPPSARRRVRLISPATPQSDGSPAALVCPPAAGGRP